MSLLLQGSAAFADDAVMVPPVDEHTSQQGSPPTEPAAPDVAEENISATEAPGAEPVKDDSANSSSTSIGGSAATVELFQSRLTQRLKQAKAPTAAGAAVAPSMGSDNEAEYRAILNEVRLAVCLPLLNNHSSLSSQARSWAQTTLNRGYAATQNNLSSLAPSADWVAQSVVGSYDWLSGYEFLALAVEDNEVIYWLIDEELTDLGVGILYNGAGYSSANVTNFASFSEHRDGVFLDVRPWSKFYTEINWMGTMGLSSGNKMEGCAGSTTYNPKNRVSREAMAAFLYRLSGANFKAPKTSPFSDVKPTDKFYKEITWMYQTKLSTGIKSAGRKPAFAPKERVSREAMAAFLYRYSKAKYSGPASSPFSDVKRGDKFYNEIAWMHNTGLSTGIKAPGKKPSYAPHDRVSREAMAAFIYRMD